MCGGTLHVCRVCVVRNDAAPGLIASIAIWRAERLYPSLPVAKNTGTYIAVLRWVVCTGTVDQTQTGWTSHLNVYANVEARAVIHIVPPV